ncbi:type II toxin-antitoxin system VapB family antitoxin [Escherichia coli]|nr:AbrB/MazE/SpoVT family DNA-binding domain-containing protein [Escherichia coli]
MRTVSVFVNGANRAIRIPRDMDFEGVKELEIIREGDMIILKPVRPSWNSLTTDVEKADPDFLADRSDIIEDKE